MSNFILKHCKKCDKETEFYNYKKPRCRICFNNIKKNQKLKHELVTKYCKECNKDTPFQNNKCLMCVKKQEVIRNRKFRESNKNQPADIVCDYHPHNTHRGSDGGKCACCKKEQNIIVSSNTRDLEKGRSKGTMTIDYIREQYNKQCFFCGTSLITIPDHHPRSLSMDRVDCTKSHDCDPIQTRPVCYQCNVFRGNQTDVVVFEILDKMAIFVLNGCKINESTHVKLPTDKIKRQLFGNLIITRKKSLQKQSKRKNAKEFKLDYKFLECTYEKQYGQCTACGLYLYKDVSFDQTIPSLGYLKNNVTLMHLWCNRGKGAWPLSELHHTAIRSMNYRINNFDHPYPFKIRENKYIPEFMNILPNYLEDNELEYNSDYEVI